MTLHIDAEAIAADYVRSRRLRLGGVTVHVAVPTLDAATTTQVVEQAAADLGFDTVRATPSNGGAAVMVPGLGPGRTDKLDRLMTVVEQLASNDVTVTAGRIGVPTYPSPTAAVPTAALGFTIRPPAGEGPLNEWGQPAYRWSVPADVSSSLFESATSWAGGPDLALQVATHGVIPVRPDEAPEAVRRSLREGHTPGSISSATPHRQLVRTVVFGAFGQSTWSDADTGRDVTAKVDHLLQVIRRHAPDLDFAAIFAGPPVSTFGHLGNSYFDMGFARNSWSSLVPDAFPVLLVTSHHLAKAGDLAGWSLEDLGEDRYLLSVRDPASWFLDDSRTYTDWCLWMMAEPMAEILRVARAALGDMILTEERYNELTPG